MPLLHTSQPVRSRVLKDTNKNHRQRNPFIKSRHKFVRPNNIAMIKRENFLPPLKNLDSLDTLLLILIRIHFL